jgi:DNA-binding MarR family transcriptional regulator
VAPKAAPFVLLAAVRRALRALNAAIDSGARSAGLTLQQQAFLLAVAARGGRKVGLGDVRAELGMDQATASELLARLVRLGLVRRAKADDRRAVDVSFTPKGRQRFARSLDRIRVAIQDADRAGELRALRDSLAAYLDHYTGHR